MATPCPVCSPSRHRVEQPARIAPGRRSSEGAERWQTQQRRRGISRRVRRGGLGALRGAAGRRRCRCAGDHVGGRADRPDGEPRRYDPAVRQASEDARDVGDGHRGRQDEDEPPLLRHAVLTEADRRDGRIGRYRPLGGAGRFLPREASLYRHVGVGAEDEIPTRDAFLGKETPAPQAANNYAVAARIN